MQDLTPVGLSEDGKRLVLASASGEEFSVPVDTRLRAALRGDNARHGQVETKMDSALRPRDIQARIRAGESPEDVAAAAQTTVEAIMPFAGPVIAERQHIAALALKGSLRRRAGETTTAARTLGEAAELFFSEHSLHDEDVEWDAWRRPDGRWALVATYAVAGRPRTAEFTHDQPGRYVVAENDEARILTGELREPGAPAASAREQARRLSPVPDQDELPLGDDALELVRERDAAARDAAARDSAARDSAAREAAPAPAVEPGADTADADWLTDTAPEPPPADPLAPTAEDVPLIEEPAPAETAAPAEAEQTEPVEDSGDSGDTGDSADTEDTAEVRRSAARRKGRSSVPSWDEIMFGGSTRED